MLLPFHVECAKQKDIKALNRISFVNNKAGRRFRMRAAASTTGIVHAVRPPSLTFIGKANGKAAGIASSAT